MCWGFIVRTTRGNIISNLLAALCKECLVKKDRRVLMLKKQVKFGTEIKEVENTNMKHPFVVIASSGQLCANSGILPIQRAFGTFKFLLGVLLLGAVMLLLPHNSMQAFAGIDGQSELSVGGYDNNLATQDLNGYDTELFNIDNSILNRNANGLPLDNTEIKIDATPDSTSPAINSQDLIQLAQSEPVVTMLGGRVGFISDASTATVSRTFDVTETNQSFGNAVYLVANFPTSSNECNHGTFVVKYNINQHGNNFLREAAGNRMLDLDGHFKRKASNKCWFIWSILIDSDTTNEPDGAITVTLQDGTGYSIPSSNNVVTINVKDDDPAEMAFVGVTDDSNWYSTDTRKYVRNLTINETDGNQRLWLMFLFPRSEAQNFNVNFTISQRQNDNYLLNTTSAQSFNPSTLTTSIVEKTNTSAVRKFEDSDTLYMYYSFTIIGDMTDEDHGIITITLQDGGANYSLSSIVSQRTTTLNVLDDDEGKHVATFVGVGSRDSTTESDFSTTLDVTEGGDTNFTPVFFLIHIPNELTANFPISYTLVERPTNNFLRGASNNTVNGSINLAFTRIAVTRNNKQYIKGSFELTNDDVSETRTTITFTLNEGDGYGILQTANTATINVS